MSALWAWDAMRWDARETDDTPQINGGYRNEEKSWGNGYDISTGLE
jgi:hypothetical protein